MADLAKNGFDVIFQNIDSTETYPMLSNIIDISGARDRNEDARDVNNIWFTAFTFIMYAIEKLI